MTRAERSTSGLIAVAMSGGLDSSVTAWMLARQGRPVVGLSMLLWDQSGVEAHGRCCGALDLGDARRVAQQAGIPHYTLRMDQEFRDKVVDPFVDDYLAGRTPSPCVRCNTWIKFDLLLERARRLGAGRVATGHYARILPGPDGPELHTAVDTDKDQSYYLFELTAEQLAASLFPLGELTKPRGARARPRGGAGGGREGGEHGGLLRGRRRARVRRGRGRRPTLPGAAASPEPAVLVDAQGEELGAGQPYYRYTVGQRRGLGLAAKSPLYVLADRAREQPGRRRRGAELMAPGLLGERLHWIGPGPGERGGRGDGEDPLPPPRSRGPHPAAGRRGASRSSSRAPARHHPRPGRRLLPGHPGPRRLLDRPAPVTSGRDRAKKRFLASDESDFQPTAVCKDAVSDLPLFLVT